MSENEFQNLSILLKLLHFFVVNIFYLKFFVGFHFANQLINYTLLCHPEMVNYDDNIPLCILKFARPANKLIFITLVPSYLDCAFSFVGSLTGIMNGISSLTGVISTPLAGAVLHTMVYYSTILLSI